MWGVAHYAFIGLKMSQYDKRIVWANKSLYIVNWNSSSLNVKLDSKQKIVPSQDVFAKLFDILHMFQIILICYDDLLI